jgi:hypothetical protein
MFPDLVVPVNAGMSSPYIYYSASGHPIYQMRNVRAEYYWQMREALDPERGVNLALPPGNEILADLCAARYTDLAQGVIQIESKDDIKKRLGRSPDVGESILLACFQPAEQGVEINYQPVQIGRGW